MDRPSATESVVRLIESHRPDALILVGIGGHGGAGKSTLASLVTDAIGGAQIVATDSFWNGSEFELGRLRSQVVDALLAGHEATYVAWDWSERRLGPMRSVTPIGVVIIEGVCALHQMFRDDLAVRIWVDAPYDVRLGRGVARDGEQSRSTWVDVWMPNEDLYVNRDDPVACAHIIVDGTLPFS